MWVWIVVAVAGAALVAIVVVVATLAWNRVVERYLRQLVGKREEARTVRRAFEGIVVGLREGTDADRARFADDPEAIERHSLDELHERARVLAEEVNVMPLPSRLVSAAEALADASDILAEEAGRAGEGTIGEESIEAIARTDIDRVARAFAHADAMLAPLCEEYGIDEQDVYGRGLYIS